MAKPGPKPKPIPHEEILRLISNGSSIREACRVNGVEQTAFHRWINNNPENTQQYARAREAQADALADEILFISDTEPDSNKARVRVDARKWVAARLRPKMWGDRVTQEHTGPGGGALKVVVEFVKPGEGK